MSKPKHIAAALQGHALRYIEPYHPKLNSYWTSLVHRNERCFSEWHFPQFLAGNLTVWDQMKDLAKVAFWKMKLPWLGRYEESAVKNRVFF